MYYCNINYAFNLKSNLGYTYPLIEQSTQKPRLSKHKLFKNFDSSVLLKVRSHMTLRNGENGEKVLEAKKSMRCEVRTTRCLALRQWCVHRVPAAYSRTFPSMTPVIWWPEHWDREWETLRSGCLAPVVQKLDSAIHRINHYPADTYYGKQLHYQLDSDLPAG